MRYVTGLVRTIRNFLIVNILYLIVESIISLDLGKPEQIKLPLGRRLFPSLPQSPFRYNPTYDPELPPAIKTSSPNYRDLLNKASQQGAPIAPVTHRKPIDKNISCPDCGATYRYIYNNATAPAKSATTGQARMVQKYKCKICGRQWLALHHRIKARLKCPFCLSTLSLKVTRQDFDVYRCLNNHCPFRRTHHCRYKFRNYAFNVLDLQASSPATPKVDFSKIHYDSSVVGLALTLYVNYKLDLRSTAHLLADLFAIPISHQTVANWIESVACLLAPLAHHIPLRYDQPLIIDDTFEKCRGRWHYLFALLQANTRVLTSHHFSPKRNVKAAATTIIAALRRLHNPPSLIPLVHDCYPAYFLAIQLINQTTHYHILSVPVKGLKDQLPFVNPYRKYKNIMERFFGTIKPDYYKTKGFGSITGAVAYHCLKAIHYNYFHRHQSLNYQTPLTIPHLTSSHPVEKWNRLIDMATYLIAQTPTD